MRFQETPLTGAHIIELDRIADERGFFARLWCEREFEAAGLRARMAQSNVGLSRERGTLRGLHLQYAPYQEIKVVRCVRGAMFDVIVDLRTESPTYKQWFGVELSAANGRMLYVPEGLAQGYLTLADDTEMYYHTSEFYKPEAATGVRWNDPAFGIRWPFEPTVMSQQDRTWPDYTG